MWFWEPALEHAGLRKFRFHDFRHTFGSLLIQAGVSVAYVQRQMGHASIHVTVDTYGHLIPGRKCQLDRHLGRQETRNYSGRISTPRAHAD